MLGLWAQLLIWWEVKMAWPVDNLAVSIVGLLGTERWPANQTLEHDCTNAPPVTTEIVSFAAENLGGNVVWRADSGIRQLTS